jgi:hypothetical protein
MAKKGRGGRRTGRPQIRNAALLRGQKPEIIKKNGKEEWRETAKKEEVEGKTMKAITATKIKQIIAAKEASKTKSESKTQEHARDTGRGIQSTVKRIIAEKATAPKGAQEQKKVIKSKSEEKKPGTKPVQNERLQRLKSSTSISTPAIADRQKLQQITKQKGTEKGTTKLIDSLKQSKPMKSPAPTKKPPTPGR